MAGRRRELPLVLPAGAPVEARIALRQRLEASDDRSPTGCRLARHEHGVVEGMGDVAGDERTRKHDLREAEGSRKGCRHPQGDPGPIAEPEADTVAETPPESRRAVGAYGEGVAVQITQRSGCDAEIDDARE